MKKLRRYQGEKWLIEWYRDPDNAEFFRRFSNLAPENHILELETMASCSLFWYYGKTPDLFPTALLIVSGYDATAGVAEIGCCVRKHLRGTKVGSSAFGALVESLFHGNSFFQKLTATCLSDNISLCSILESEGFVTEAYLPRNVYFQGKIQGEKRYAIYKEDFEDRHGERFVDRAGKELRDYGGSYGVDYEDTTGKTVDVDVGGAGMETPRSQGSD